MKKDDFQVILGMTIDDAKAQKQLQQFTKKREIVTKIKIDGEDALKTMTTYMNKLGQSFQTLKFTDQMGDSIEEVVKLSDNFQSLDGIVKETSTTTTNYVNAQNQLVTSIEKLNADGTKYRTEIIKTKDAVGQTEIVTNEYRKVLDAQGKEHEKLVSTNKEATRTTQEYANAQKKTKNTTDTLTKSNKQLGQSFIDVVKKVTKFYVATAPVLLLRQAISDSIEVVKEFDDAMTEFAKVSSLSGEELQDYTKKLGELGKEVARTRTEMVEASTEFKKGGFSEEDSAKLARLASLYQNTADEELSASEATSVLISQMKAFNYTAEDAIHITDAINQVSQDFAVSSGDIGKGLTQAGASLQTYGNNFDQTIGLKLGLLKPIELLENPYSLLNYNITMKYA